MQNGDGPADNGEDAPEDQQEKAAEKVMSTDKPARASQNSDHPGATTDSRAGSDAKDKEEIGEKEDASQEAVVVGAVEGGQQHAPEDEATVPDDAAAEDSAKEEAQARAVDNAVEAAPAAAGKAPAQPSGADQKDGAAPEGDAMPSDEKDLPEGSAR